MPSLKRLSAIAAFLLQAHAHIVPKAPGARATAYASPTMHKKQPEETHIVILPRQVGQYDYSDYGNTDTSTGTAATGVPFCFSTDGSGYETAGYCPGYGPPASTAAPATTAAPTTAPPSIVTATGTDGLVSTCAYDDAQILGSVTVCGDGSPVVSTVSSLASAASASAQATADLASWDVATCLWGSDWAGMDQKWVVVLPSWGYTAPVSDTNFKGALGGDWRCGTYTAYHGFSAGASNTTLVATFNTNDLCTAWDMTQIIKQTTNDAQSTACTEYDTEGTDPDLSNAVAELFEDGDDGEERIFPLRKREIDQDKASALVAKLEMRAARKSRSNRSNNNRLRKARSAHKLA